MKEVRQAINTKLKSIHPKTYFLQSPSTAPFPRLIYSIEITDLEDGLRLVTLDVDGWDNKEDTTALEDLMISVKNEFNKNLVINDQLFISFYLDKQLALPDDNPQLNRRTNTFLGRLYER